MEIDEAKLKKFLDWVYGMRFSWTDNASIEELFQQVHKAFGEDIFKKLGIDKEA